MREKIAWSMNGYLGVGIIAVLIVAMIFSLFNDQFIVAFIFFIIALILGTGITLIQPNEAVVVIYFGKYIGSVRREGLVLTVPLTSRKRVSLRVRNVKTKGLKVNDINGKPLEIAAVIVCKVVDSAKAVFDLEQYEQSIELQSESALCALATKYPYESLTEEEIILPDNIDQLAHELKIEVQGRLDVAGVDVIDAHLTYKTE